MSAPITEMEYRRIRQTIRRLTAIDELAAFRAEIRVRYHDDPKLARVERRINFRANQILMETMDA